MTQLKCVYTNTHSTGSTHEELEATAQLEWYNLITIIETWWEGSHDWSAAINSQKLFSRDRQGKRSRQLPSM